MKYYDFSVVLRGYGETPEKAWDDIRQDFIDNAHPIPNIISCQQEKEIEILTLDKLKGMKHREIIATGVGTYPELDRDRTIRWVAVRGGHMTGPYIIITKPMT